MVLWVPSTDESIRLVHCWRCRLTQVLLPSWRGRFGEVRSCWRSGPKSFYWQGPNSGWLDRRSEIFLVTRFLLGVGSTKCPWAKGCLVATWLRPTVPFGAGDLEPYLSGGLSGKWASILKNRLYHLAPSEGHPSGPFFGGHTCMLWWKSVDWGVASVQLRYGPGVFMPSVQLGSV